MTAKAINLNHSTGTISTDTDQTITIDNKLIIGDGTSPSLYDADHKLEDGLLSVKKTEDNLPQLCKANKNGQWEVIAEPYDDSIELIYTIIMSG